MTATPRSRPNTLPRAMWPVLLFVQLGKRLGLAKSITRFALGRMFSPEKLARAFAGYEAGAGDVFVATFGKSGTNWMMQIAQQIAHRGHAEFEHIHDVVPWPDSPGPGPIALTDITPRESSPTGLRVIKTHIAAEFVPYSEQAIYLTVLRDPKEVLVSSYYFLGGILGMLSHVTIDDWFEIFARPDRLAGRWAEHTASFWKWRDRPNALVLGYREIIERPIESIERVAAAMGVELTASERDEVVRRSSFGYMKAHEAQFAPPKPPFTSETDRPKMIRRGQAGGSEEALSRGQQAALDRLCRAELLRLGSDFPYAKMFDMIEDPTT